MSESAIRTEIYNTMNGIANIGKVYDYERWSTDWGTFINLFKGASGKILGWEIGRKGHVKDEEQGTLRVHTYSIKGYMGLKDADASEKAFNSLIESISAAFRGNQTLNGSAAGHDYIEVETLDTRTFGSVLCHFTELSLTVYENIA